MLPILNRNRTTSGRSINETGYSYVNCDRYIYLNQIYLTGGIPFAVALPNTPSALNADLMTVEEIHTKLQESYDDLRAGKV